VGEGDKKENWVGCCDEKSFTARVEEMVQDAGGKDGKGEAI